MLDGPENRGLRYPGRQLGPDRGRDLGAVELDRAHRPRVVDAADRQLEQEPVVPEDLALGRLRVPLGRVRVQDPVDGKRVRVSTVEWEGRACRPLPPFGALGHAYQLPLGVMV